MTGRFLPTASYLGLKARFRDLVRAVGGPVRAATISRLGASEYSRGGSISERDIERFPPADVIADLEAEVGEPIITRYLAELADCMLVPVPKGDGSDALSAEVGAMAQRFGQMVQDYAGLRAGELDAASKRKLVEDGRLLLQAVATLIETVKAEKTNG